VNGKEIIYGSILNSLSVPEGGGVCGVRHDLYELDGGQRIDVALHQREFDHHRFSPMAPGTWSMTTSSSTSTRTPSSPTMPAVPSHCPPDVPGDWLQLEHSSIRRLHESAILDASPDAPGPDQPHRPNQCVHRRRSGGWGICPAAKWQLPVYGAVGTGPLKGRYFYSDNTNGMIGGWNSYNLCVEYPRTTFGQSTVLALTGSNAQNFRKAIAISSATPLNHTRERRRLTRCEGWGTIPDRRWQCGVLF